MDLVIRSLSACYRVLPVWLAQFLALSAVIAVFTASATFLLIRPVLRKFRARWNHLRS